MSYRVGVIGATGAVGQKFLACLEERSFPASEVVLFASEKSEGRVLHFRGRAHRIVGLRPERVDRFDFAFFSAGAALSREYAPRFAERGATVIDNSSAWRMEPDVPLVVPEVNPHVLAPGRKIIANPNCSTIQLVVALKPIHDAARLRRVVVSTYQAISGAGGRALEEFEGEIRASVTGDGLLSRSVFPRPMAFNVLPEIPHAGPYLPSGSTKEEEKMVQETRKILEEPELRVAATCVRVPVRNGHSESVNIETERFLGAAAAVEILRGAPGVRVAADPAAFPTALEADGRDEVFVGRVREDVSTENGLHLWIVADNLRKGAALNAVQIAELLIK